MFCSVLFWGLCLLQCLVLRIYNPLVLNKTSVMSSILMQGEIQYLREREAGRTREGRTGGKQGNDGRRWEESERIREIAKQEGRRG